MQRENRESKGWVELWARELKSAIEALSGRTARVEYGLAESVPKEAELAGYFWWQQSYGEGPEFLHLWQGAPEELWKTLGKATVQSGESTEQAYLRLLARCQQRTAALLSPRLGRRAAIGPGQLGRPRALEPAMLWEIRIRIGDETLPPMLLAGDPAIGRVLRQLPAGSSISADSEDPIVDQEKLERLMDLELPLAVVLGRAVRPVRDLLKMTPGTTFELDRNVGAVVDLLVHGTLVAHGELVSIRGNYGVRIKHLISRQARLALPGKS